jgi:hypothetical protein
MSASLFFAVRIIKYMEDRAGQALTLRQTCGPVSPGITQSRIANRGASGAGQHEFVVSPKNLLQHFLEKTVVFSDQ